MSPPIGQGRDDGLRLEHDDLPAACSVHARRVLDLLLNPPAFLKPRTPGGPVPIDPNLPSSCDLTLRFCGEPLDTRLENVRLHWALAQISAADGAVVVPFSLRNLDAHPALVTAVTSHKGYPLLPEEDAFFFASANALLTSKDRQLLGLPRVRDFRREVFISLADLAEMAAAKGLRTELRNQPNCLCFVDSSGQLQDTDATLAELAPAISRRRIAEILGAAEPPVFSPLKEQSKEARIVPSAVHCNTLQEVKDRILEWCKNDGIDTSPPLSSLTGLDADYLRKIGKTPLEYMFDCIDQHFSKDSWPRFTLRFPFCNAFRRLINQDVRISRPRDLSSGYLLDVETLADLAESSQKNRMVIRHGEIVVDIPADDHGLVHIDPRCLFGLSPAQASSLVENLANDRSLNGTVVTFPSGREVTLSLSLPGREGQEAWAWRTDATMITVFGEKRSPGERRKVLLEVSPRRKPDEIVYSDSDFAEELRSYLNDLTAPVIVP